MKKKVLSVMFSIAITATVLTACGNKDISSTSQIPNSTPIASSAPSYQESSKTQTSQYISKSDTNSQVSISAQSNAQDKYNEVINIINSATLQYPSSNDKFKYNVYDTYIQITKCISDDTDIVFPSTIDNLPVLIIGDGTHLLSYKHDSITIQEGIAIIGDNSFFGSHLPQNFKLPNSLLEIRDDAFGYADVPNIEFPSNLRKIGNYAFKGATGNDWNIVIPEKVESIGRSCFDDFTSKSFKSIKFLNPNTKIVNVSENSLNRHTVIYGYAGSTAAKYASEKGNEFKLITD